MQTILQEAFSSYNLPLTIVLGVVGLYWLISLVGVMDFDALDGMLGLDGDGGVDADADAGDDHHGGWFQGVMKALGLTDAPVMFVLTLYALGLWGLNMIGSIYFNEARSDGRATLIFVIALFGSFLFTRLAVRPLRPLMRLVRDTEKRQPIAGMTGEVRSLSVSPDSGQVEVLRDGAPILLQARTSEDGGEIPRGTEVLVVMKDDESGAYIVRPLAPRSVPAAKPSP